ncbi:ABC transporter ATP-binding protein [Brucella suis bv. 2]|nr:ABC transporter ATP-binding protein [Brucella suis bv. 2]QOK76171.1 ABC transporter ATP-binding protein [Brucella suis bv. 2]
MLLDIKNLTVSFDTSTGPFKAVDGIDITVNKGEVLAIVGESGSGKSVGMLAVMGLLPKTATVTADVMMFDGMDLRTLSDSQRRKIIGRDISMIFQEPVASLNPCFTVGYQLEEVLKQHMGMGASASRARAIELLELVGIRDAVERLKSFPHQMSGGQCQRVMIAIAIACNPKLLIADEPTTALDVTIQKQILDLLMRLQVEHGMGLIMITHDMGVVAETADRVIVQYKGHKMEDADVLSLFSAPKHPYTRALLSALPENATGNRLPTVSDFVFGEYQCRRSAMSEIVLEARDIKRDYHVGGGLFGKPKVVHAVKGVSFKVEKGKTLAIVGESGCGNSTLARILTMIDPQTSGELKIGGKDVNIARDGLLPEMRQKVQIVFQNPYGSLNPRQKIGDVLAEPLLLNTNMSADERRSKAMQMLLKVGLEREHFNRYPHMFSGGQRQRIAIARALMLNPKRLILDEPVFALDLSVQAQVLNLLSDLQEEFGLTYVFISHDLSVVRYIADDVMVMYFGEVVEYGSRDDVFNNPQHDYTKKLFAATPRADVNAIRARVEARAAARQAVLS